MPSKKIRLTISDLWTNQYTYFIIVGFIVGICAGFSNVIFHWLYNTVNLLFISPLESSNMVIFGTIVGGLILFFISYLSDRDDILGYKFHKFCLLYTSDAADE